MVKALVDQLLTTIEAGNVDKFHLTLISALAQQSPIDLNQTLQNGHTFLTFAGMFMDFMSKHEDNRFVVSEKHYNPSIIDLLLNEKSVDVQQVDAFNRR